MLSRAVMRSIDMNKTLLVTGAAGFIGSHVTQALLVRGDTVVGLDKVNEYYDPAHKFANLGRSYPLWLRFGKRPIWLRLKAYIHPEDVPPHPY